MSNTLDTQDNGLEGRLDNPSSRADNLTSRAKEMGRDLQNRASETAETVMQKAREQASDLKGSAEEFAANAKNKALEAVDRQRSVGADLVADFAQSVNRAAGEFDQSMPQAGEYIRRAAQQVEQVADAIRTKDAQELMSEVQAFARRQPTLFFGGAVILGFAALRFFKSAGESSRNGYES